MLSYKGQRCDLTFALSTVGMVDTADGFAGEN